MHGYLCGTQRVLRNDLGVTKLELFSYEELINRVDNRFKGLQRNGLVTESHNTLSVEDVQIIFKYLNHSAITGQGYRDRLVFGVGLATGLRPIALHTLTTGQLKKENVRGTPCIIFYSVLGGVKGESKTAGGGWRAVSEKPQVFPIPNEPLLGGLVNLYEIIDEYLSWRVSLNTDSERFFLGVRQGGTTHGTKPEHFFTRQHLGKGSFSKIVKSVCEKLGVRGDGAKEIVTTHGLRATMVVLLTDAGYDDSTIIKILPRNQIERMKKIKLGKIYVEELRNLALKWIRIIVK